MAHDPAEVLIQRAALLLEQRRFEAAQGELRRILADDPESQQAHALLALALANDDRIGDDSRTPKHREQLAAASVHAQAAISSDPNNPLGYYALSITRLRSGELESAVEAGRSALALDPYDADFHAIVANALLRMRKYGDSLAAAEAGLQVDPEHGACTNLRSLSLERLGRGDDAISAAKVQLSRDPDDSTAHAAVGFAHLNQGEYKQAQLAFREALRLDPNDEFARSGMIDAINSANPLYRLLHRYFVAVSRMNQRWAFGLLIGLWLLVNNIDNIAAKIPILQPIAQPLVLLYIAFAVSTWIAKPLMNTMLRLHPLGKHLLNGIERLTSNLIAICLLFGLFVLVAAWSLGLFNVGVMGAVYGLILAVLVSATMNQQTAIKRWCFAAASIFVASLPWIGLATIIFVDQHSPLAGLCLSGFTYGALVIQIASQVSAARDHA